VKRLDVALEVRFAAKRRDTQVALERALLEVHARHVALEVRLEAKGMDAAVKVALKLANPLVRDLDVLFPHALASKRCVANRAMVRFGRCLWLVEGRLVLPGPAVDRRTVPVCWVPRGIR
jgi:hypothetical protein